MANVEESYKILNDLIIQEASKYIIDGKCTLIKEDEAPNSNTIYHLYNDGEITEQKGGSVYGMRSERTLTDSKFREYYGFLKTNKLKLTYKRGKYSYVILPEDMCIYFRNEMNKLV